MRVSATDDIHYEQVRVPLDRCADWFGANRAETLRTVPVVDPATAKIGLVSDVWLGWMGVGLVRAALTDALKRSPVESNSREGNGVSTHRPGEPRSSVVTRRSHAQQWKLHVERSTSGSR